MTCDCYLKMKCRRLLENQIETEYGLAEMSFQTCLTTKVSKGFVSTIFYCIR